MINPESVNIFDLPSVPMKLKAFLPESRGIYFVYDALGAVWYIGATINLHNRFEKYPHHKREEFKQSVAFSRVAYIELNIEDNLGEAEIAFVKYFCPNMNYMHVPKPMKNARDQIRLSRWAELVDRYFPSVSSDQLLTPEEIWECVKKVEPIIEEMDQLHDDAESMAEMAEMIRRHFPKHLTKAWIPFHIENVWEKVQQPQY